ncbi:VOC family protein [Primorskyibacter sp. S87]|uniref:VOC family protein n=1 Tax=Primorskyibacter sp. S87 TaxID=3415126 RepID=UPI003C7E754A
MTATLEHANFTVADLRTTSGWMADVFGWKIRWEGDAIAGGRTAHVGTDDAYLALYQPPAPQASGESSYDIIGGLNHIGVVVDDLNAVESRVKAAGFTPRSHADYEPGHRFYFDDENGIEFEVVSYK